jgi:hypothetical protein
VSLHEQLSFYSDFHMVLKDCSTRGIRQGNIKHAPKTRNVFPIKVLNPPKVENQS